MTTEFKEACFQECIFILENKLSSYKKDLDLLKETSEGEQKSSMGDKYETTTEMLAQEKRKLVDQVNIISQQLSLIIKLHKEYKPRTKIEVGCLIETNKGFYFLTTSLGKITVNKETVFVLSPSSPIGQKFLGKSVTNVIVQNSIEIEIMCIL